MYLLITKQHESIITFNVMIYTISIDVRVYHELMNTRKVIIGNNNTK